MAGIESPVILLSAALLDSVTQADHPRLQLCLILRSDLRVGRTSETLGEEALLEERVVIVGHWVEILTQCGELWNSFLCYGNDDPQRACLRRRRVDAEALTFRVDGCPHDRAVGHRGRDSIRIAQRRVDRVEIREERAGHAARSVGRDLPEIAERVCDACQRIGWTGRQANRARDYDAGTRVRTAREAGQLTLSPHATLHRVDLHPADLGELRVAHLGGCLEKIAPDLNWGDVLRESRDVLICCGARLEPAEINEAGYEIVLLVTVDVERGRENAVPLEVERLAVVGPLQHRRHCIVYN